MYTHSDKSDRPDSVTVTQLSACARAIYLDQTVEYYAEPMTNYPAFRGTLTHELMEKFAPAGAVTESRYYREWKGVTLSGQIDSWRILGADAQVTYDWDQWLLAGAEDPQPDLPDGARFLVRDWKTKHVVPTYPYLAQRYQQQGNLYAWLLRIPRPDLLDCEFVFLTMEDVKTQRLLNGGNYSNGRVKPEQIWTPKQLETYLDNRLLTLEASKKLDKPLPYAKVPTDDLWNCSYCAIREGCYRLAAEEARLAWAKGEPVDRLPPRDREAEKKAAS
jgi:hypothetical protein